MINELEINKVKEIYPGHYFALLDFPTNIDLYKIIDLSYKYIWGTLHSEIGVEWDRYTGNIFGKQRIDSEIEIRNNKFEYLIHTNDFLNLIPDINTSINIIQTNIKPPSYLNIQKLEGKRRYDILKEKVDYLFEIEMPGATDYATIISPSKKFLIEVIKKLN